MKVKTLIERLKKYDPEMSVEIGVKAEVKTKKDKASEYEYLFTTKLGVGKYHSPKNNWKKMYIRIHGSLESLLHL